MDQGVQTSGGLANNAGAGGGMARVPRGGGGGGYQRGHDGYFPRGAGGRDGYVPRGSGGGQDSYKQRGDTYMRGGGGYDGYSRGGGNVDRRRYQPQYHQSYTAARYQQNGMRGPRPPMRGRDCHLFSLLSCCDGRMNIKPFNINTKMRERLRHTWSKSLDPNSCNVDIAVM